MAASTSQFAHPRGPLGWLAGAVMAIENRQRNEVALDVLAVQPGDHILEIGFGPGATIARLAELVGEGAVAGVDASLVMVAQARRRNAEAIEQGKVDLRHGSVALLPFPDATFDKALAVNSQEHWPHPLANLREVRRVLKPGGFVVIAEQPVWARAGADDCRFAADLAARVAEAGFGEVKTVSRRMRPAPTICVRGRKPDQGHAMDHAGAHALLNDVKHRGAGGVSLQKNVGLHFARHDTPPPEGHEACWTRLVCSALPTGT